MNTLHFQTGFPSSSGSYTAPANAPRSRSPVYFGTHALAHPSPATTSDRFTRTPPPTLKTRQLRFSRVRAPSCTFISTLDLTCGHRRLAPRLLAEPWTTQTNS